MAFYLSNNRNIRSQYNIWMVYVSWKRDLEKEMWTSTVDRRWKQQHRTELDGDESCMG